MWVGCWVVAAPRRGARRGRCGRTCWCRRWCRRWCRGRSRGRCGRRHGRSRRHWCPHRRPTSWWPTSWRSTSWWSTSWLRMLLRRHLVRRRASAVELGLPHARAWVAASRRRWCRRLHRVRRGWSTASRHAHRPTTRGCHAMGGMRELGCVGSLRRRAAPLLGLHLWLSWRAHTRARRCVGGRRAVSTRRSTCAGMVAGGRLLLLRRRACVAAVATRCRRWASRRPGVSPTRRWLPRHDGTMRQRLGKKGPGETHTHSSQNERPAGLGTQQRADSTPLATLHAVQYMPATDAAQHEAHSPR